MTYDVGMVTDGAGDPKVFPESSLKGLCRFPYVLLITIQFVTLVSVDYSNFLCDIVSVLGGHQEILDGDTFLEMYLDTHLAADVLEAFT